MTFMELLAKSLRVDGSLLSQEETAALLEAALADVVASECPGHIFRDAREPLECDYKCAACWNGEAVLHG